MLNQFGVYIHIPYCIQRCTYCDFATYVQSEILAPNKYIELVKKEILLRRQMFNLNSTSDVKLDTLYFGGGTPSLIPSELIVDLIAELNKHGLRTGPQTEITIEINPATIDERKLEHYLSAGINRFSVGAQTFHDRLLKMVKREHSSEQTIQTLSLLKKYKLNFSFDLLFALPTQTLEELSYDVEKAVEIGSSHISPYCLTVPENHPLSKNRPLEEDQIQMFSIIHEALQKSGFNRYEISNYSKPGFESRHNNLYWTDQSYWGLGLSAHSYSRSPFSETPWGERFWNPSNINIYEQQVLANQKNLPTEQIERLEKHQSLTDFCHTSLRLAQGLDLNQLKQKFGASLAQVVSKKAEKLLSLHHLVLNDNCLQLTENGVLISNQIFEAFTFLDVDIL
ncbi:MAG: radical SAM family heme chaperone HemW [Pseudobdellovibrio sp.]